MSNFLKVAIALLTLGCGLGARFARADLPAAYAFPNPAVKRDPTIRVSLGEVARLSISIFNAAGRKVHSGEIAGVPAGALAGRPYYDYIWTGSKANGVYLAVIRGRTADGKPVRANARVAVVR